MRIACNKVGCGLSLSLLHHGGPSPKILIYNSIITGAREAVVGTPSELTVDLIIT
jgi:hypothetical protein